VDDKTLQFAILDGSAKTLEFRELAVDDKTLQFAIFTAFSAAALAGGYFSRERGWLREEVSRPIHYHSVVWIWSATFLLSTWKIELSPGVIWLAVIQPIAVIAPTALMLLICRALKMSRRRTGVMVVGAGVGNLGFTLGAFLAYTVSEHPDAALAYGAAAVAIMNLTGVVVLYPLCRHFGEGQTAQEPAWKLVLGTFVDLRALLLYMAALGILLSWLEAPFPQWTIDYYIRDVLIYLSALGPYFGIGLNLHLGDAKQYFREHVLLGVMRFGFIPLLTFGMVALAQLTPFAMNPTLREVVLIEGAMPAALLTVILANLFHLDVRLACVLWLWNTIAFVVFVMPVTLWLTW